MFKILYCIAAICCTLWGAQIDQLSENSSFNLALNTFINGLDRHEGVVDNTLLLDFRRNDATAYLETICDRLNQMELSDMNQTESTLKDISFKIIHSQRVNLFESKPNNNLNNTSITQFLKFLPMFKNIQLIDSTRHNHIDFTNNVTYFNKILDENGIAFSYKSQDELNKCRAFIWEKFESHDPSNDSL